MAYTGDFDRVTCISSDDYFRPIDESLVSEYIGQDLYMDITVSYILDFNIEIMTLEPLPEPVPEPASLMLFGAGIVGLSRKRLRNRTDRST